MVWLLISQNAALVKSNDELSSWTGEPGATFISSTLAVYLNFPSEALQKVYIVQNHQEAKPKCKQWRSNQKVLILIGFRILLEHLFA